MTEQKDRPYKPAYKGFDEEATLNAHATVDRANETAGALGEDANREYMEDGADEYERRMGSETPDIERAAHRGKKR